MQPRERGPYSAIVDRPALPPLPGGNRIIFWTIVNVEIWDITRPMPRMLLMPPQGQVRFPEIDRGVSAGELFGEIGLFSLERRRTQTAVAATDVDLLWISDAALKKLCERNPGLSLYFLRLTATRMTENAARAIGAAAPNPV